ncbi:hypothetical protein DKB58_09250 [Capnocytophaga canimorsus]|uniref:Ig-like domain-containing protein n=1 Tax=Capnocytophaga canimorsus TaxID=28188 RepID=UPI000D6EA2F2|nr:hypothetical protein [Capnocytophaga canimorsus]AWL79110.1 hypothetical protein DKB58_09250 [Capnocytophaga canimorsus]
MRILFKLFFFLVSPMLWAQGNPPTTLPTPSGDCDAYFDGLIKQTKASVFSPIESGSNAVIYLDNSRMATGVTYFAINKATGMWFAGSYDTTLFMVTIPVGVLTQNTTFEVHAIAGGCSFKVVDDVTFEVKPITEVHLQTRVRDEYCDNSGGIYYQMMGDSNDNYNFYHKLSTQTAFQTATADRNDLQTVQGGKTYVIRAELKTDSNTFYEKTITVKDAKVPNPPGIEYAITAQPILCGANTGRAIVNITKGVSYPFTFKITSGPETRPEQSSNVFENLPAGNYTMYVKDACGQGRTVSFRIDGQAFYIGPIGGSSYIKPTDECGRGAVSLQRGIKMARNHWYTDAIPYPMTVSYTLTSPSGVSYATTRSFNNRTELVAYAGYDYNQESVYFYHNVPTVGNKNFFGDGVQIPFEKGNWTHNFQVTTACGTHNLALLIEKVKTKEDDFNHWARIDKAYDTCGKTYIYATVEWLHRFVYMVLDEAPIGFDPVAAGFTKNHRFGGKYYKYGQLAKPAFPLVSYPHLLLGDYKFTYVHAECGFEVQRQITVTDLQNPVGVPNTSQFHSTYYCENESYGILFRPANQEQIPKKIRITAFTPASGTSGTFTVPQEYDYDQLITLGSGRIITNLPFGTYTLSAIGFDCQDDVVNKVVTVHLPTPDPKVRFTMVTGCKVQVELYDATNDNYQRKYSLQGYDKTQARWVNMIDPNISPYGDLLSSEKKNATKSLANNKYRLYSRYRVVELTNVIHNSEECLKVIGEYQAPSELPTLVDIVGATCGLNQYQIMVVASGGTPPFTYKILSRSVGGSLDTSFVPITNTTGKFTITETNPSASYKFAVEDVCNQETKDVEIRNMTPFVITTDRTEYCQGTSATLSVPDLSLAYTYEWFREDDPSTILSHSPTLQVSNLQATDFAHKYKLRVAPKDASFTLCIPAEYQVQLTGSTASVPVLTGDATNVVLCASELDGKASYDIRTNLFATVHNNATASGYTNGVVREVSGTYPVSQNGLMALHIKMIPILEGQTFTFTYTISNACGLEATKTATLTIKRNISPKDLSPNAIAFNVCEGDLTNFVTFEANHFNDLTQYIKVQNTARTTDVIEFFSDEQGNTPIHQFHIVAGSRDIFYKINRANYCSSIARVRIIKNAAYKKTDGTEDPRLADLNYNTCANGVTVQDVRARLQQIFGRYSTPKVYLIRMVGGVETSSELPDTYALTTSEVYRYRMEDGGCPSSWRNITLNFNQTNIVTQPVSHIVCSGEQVVLTALGASTSPPTAGKMIYKWFESTYNGTIGATQVHAQTLNRGEASTYTPSTASMGAKYYFVEVTVENVCNVPMYTNIVKVEVKGMTASVPTVTTLSSVQCGEDVKFTFTGVPNEEVHYTVNGVASTITLPTSGVYTHTVSNATTTQVLRVVSVSNASGCPTIPTTGNVYTVTVNDLPTPTVHLSDALCGINGTTATITNYDSSFTYTLIPNTANLIGNTITGMVLGTSYKLEVRNGTCTVASTPFQAKVALPVPTPPAVTNQVFCASADTATFVATPTAGHTLRWYDTVTSTTFETTAPSVSLNVTTQTTFTKYVSQVNAEGCESDKLPIKIAVRALPTAPTVTVLTPAVCLGGTAQFVITGNVSDTVTYNLNGTLHSVTLTATTHNVTIDNVTSTQTLTLVSVENTKYALYEDFGIGAAICSPDVKLPKCRALVSTYVGAHTYEISNKNSAWYDDITSQGYGWLRPNDHTSNGKNDEGRFLVANLGVPNMMFYEKELTGIESNTPVTLEFYYFSLSQWTAPPDAKLPVIRVRLVDENGTVVAQDETPSIPNGNILPNRWNRFQISGNPRNSTKLKIQFINRLYPDKWNDVAIDDIRITQESTCILPLTETKTVTVKALPTPTINAVTATCGNSGSVTITNYDAANTYTFSDAAITHTGATITGFAFGTTYTMTVSNGTCTETTSFVVNTTCTIDAVDDPLIEVDALSTHRTSAISILDNDVLGTLSATTANVTITQLSTTDARVNIDPATGKIRLTNSTVPTGIYTITYRICEEVNDTPCDTATITVKVRNIKAENDVVSYIAGLIADNILYNDTYNNEEAFDYYNDLKITITSPLPSGVTIEPGGDFKITESVRSGVYTFTYQICSEVLPDVCDSATVTLTVRNIISAYDDNDGDYLNGYSVVPNNTIDIFENDRLNSHFVTSQTVTISSHTALPTGVTIDANGIVTIGNDTPTGVHSFTYVLCEKDVTPPICDSAKVLFTVKNINADNDDFEVSAGGNTGSVLNNDKYDGEFLSSTVSVTLTPIGTLPSGISLDPITGIVRVASGTPSGNYSFNYKICSKVVHSLCDEATVTIRVKNSIIADDDNLGTVVSGGTTTQTVISNDKLNGTLVVIGAGTGEVTLTPLITPTGITLNGDGKVTVGTNVSSGVYTLTYKICENGATPDNCDEATVTITVQNGIVAEDDDLGTVVSGGTTTQTVISNDKLNGTPVVIGTGVGQVTLTPIITPTGITIDATNGKVSVGNNVPSGVYTLTYKICENGATPDNCDEATVTVTVENSIVADNDDLGPVVSGGTTTQTVITNDRLNGTPVVIGTGVGQVTLTPIITPTGITIDATNGKVSVGNNVSSGVYTLTYKICENGATPDNCDEATVTVTVENSIVADNDDLGPVVSGGTTTQTVITNDRLNGTPVVIGTGLNLIWVSFMVFFDLDEDLYPLFEDRKYRLIYRKLSF